MELNISLLSIYLGYRGGALSASTPEISVNWAPFGALVPFPISPPPGIRWRLSGTLPSMGARRPDWSLTFLLLYLFYYYTFFTIIPLFGQLKVCTLRLGAGNRRKLAPIWSPGPLRHTPYDFGTFSRVQGVNTCMCVYCSNNWLVSGYLLKTLLFFTHSLLFISYFYNVTDKITIATMNSQGLATTDKRKDVINYYEQNFSIIVYKKHILPLNKKHSLNHNGDTYCTYL